MYMDIFMHIHVCILIFSIYINTYIDTNNINMYVVTETTEPERASVVLTLIIC